MKEEDSPSTGGNEEKLVLGMMAAEDDEALLLAALGSTTASASVYESSVLRDAQLRSAPQIVLLPHSTIAVRMANDTLHTSSLVPCGGEKERPTLPNLSSLTPSTSSLMTTTRKNIGAADVPHVITLLSRTRDLLRSTKAKGTQGIVVANNEAEQRRRREIDKLMMKEQILLGYLLNVVGLKEDDAVIPQSRERQRTNSNIDIADDYYGINDVPRVDDIKDEAFSNANNDKSNKHGMEEKSNNGRILSTNRLDRIKNGEQLLLSETSSQKRPIRNTIMSMKSQMRVETGMTPLKSMEEERFDEEKSRTRREERRKRRVQKHRVALGMKENCSSSDEECEFEATSAPRKIISILKSKNCRENDDEKKTDDTDTHPLRLFKNGMEVYMEGDFINNNESNMDCQDEQTINSGVRWTISTNETVTPSKSPDLKRRSHTKVFCPVCQVILTLDLTKEDGISPDRFLAQHIKECQEINRSRNGGRILRKRKKPSSIDLEDDEIKDAENQIDAQSDYAPANDDLPLDNDDSNGSNTKNPSPTAIDDINELDYEERVDDWIEHGLEQMNDMAERDSAETPPGAIVYEGGLEIPAWVNDRLFPYQRTGVRWMWELHSQGAGGVVGDEMGLGKTVQVSSFLGAMASSRLLDSVLIVAPATMLSHWLRELKVWAPGLRRIMVHKSGERDGVSRSISRGMLRHLQKWLNNARADRLNEPIDEDDYNAYEEHAFCGTGYAIVTTYESIRRSDDFTSHTWSYVVLDEGQKIRNPDAEVTLACKRLRTPHRLLLSGTPIQNDLRELWSLFDFIFPGRLGTLPVFEAEFAEPIKRGGYSNASPMQVQLAYRCALVLRDLINPYLLRRQKKDVSEVNRMPGKTEQVLFCRLTPRQRSLYEEYLRSDEVTGVLRGSVHLLKAITVLRKICNHIDLVVGPNGSLVNDDDENSSSDDDFYDQENIADRSGKLQVLSKILPLWHQQGHKVIIFTQWRKMLGIIEYFANTQGWKYARLDGNTNVASRQTLVDKFNTDPTYFCILMTTRTGGVGLNITGANRVLLYDPDWNPQTDAQARERAYRFGQKRDVTVYRLITAGTIEEKIYQRQIFKTALTNQILQDPKQRRLFSQKDLRDLFTLKADTNSSTETGDITKGQGVVEMNSSVKPNESEDDDEQPGDNSNTLEAVIKSKGICGVFDHDFVENSSAKKKPLSVVEMEENARKEATRKASALKHSTVNHNMFAPTWTGSDETKPAMASSTSLLANLHNKRMQIAASSSSSIPDFNTALLTRLRKYIRRVFTTNNGLGPTTRDILAAFQDVPDSQAATFRSLLKSIAVIDNGHWVFKKGQS